MRQHSLWKIGAAVLAGTLALSACGNRDDPRARRATAPPAPRQPPSAGGEARTVKIGVIAPLSGDLSALGLGIQHSVDLAIQQANESGELGNVTIELDAQDDEANADVGQQAASLLADDDEVIGVVGTLNSSVAQTVAPVLADGRHHPGLAGQHQPDPHARARTGRPPRRACGTPTSAPARRTTRRVASPRRTSTRRSASRTSRSSTTRRPTAPASSRCSPRSSRALGGTITTTEVINPDEDDYSAVVGTVAATSPELVYYGGEYPQAGPLSAQMAAGGLNVPLMGGDGIYDPAYIELGGRDADVATSVGAPAEDLDSAAAFIEAYEAAGFPDPYSAYGAQSFDAANAIIAALKAALEADPDAEGEDLRARGARRDGRRQLRGCHRHRRVRRERRHHEHAPDRLRGRRRRVGARSPPASTRADRTARLNDTPAGAGGPKPSRPCGVLR